MAAGIGFDAKRAFFNRSGLGNYSRTLISSLLKYHPEFNYRLYSPEYKKTSLFSAYASLLSSPEASLDRMFPALWRSYNITKDLKRNQTALCHGLSNELPFSIKDSGIKSIVTIHDLIFLKYPNLYPFVDRQVYHLKFRRACADADVIIAISEATKKDIILYFNTPAEKIKVAYQSCNPSYFTFSPETEKAEKISKKYQLPSQFMLYVGTMEERKNLLTIIKALAMLPPSERIPLVAIGGKRKDYFKKVKEYLQTKKLEHLVIFPEGVEDDELPYFYNQATLFIYPSLYEGFGLPVLEALLCRTPVITSGVSSMPEAGGPASIYLANPADVSEMANSISSLLSAGTERASILHEGFNWAQSFHPEKTSTVVANIYHQLLQNK
jgi:glycosyltransferase involved in cell wall biosynthesis